MSASGRRRPRLGKRLPTAIGLLLVGAAALLLSPGSPAGLGAGGAHPESAPSAGASHWSTFHGSENRSGFTPVDGPSVGKVVWEVAPPGASVHAIRVAPVLDDAAVYFSNDLGTVYAFNRSGGGPPVWSVPLGTTNTAGDVVGPELVVGAGNGGVTAIWTSNGSVRWSQTLRGPIAVGVAVANGSVFAGTAAGELAALDASTGAPLWNRSVGGAIVGAVAVEGGQVFASTADGGVVAYSTDGLPIWRSSVGARLESGPAVSNGVLVVGDLSGNVTALSLTDGSTLWRFVGRNLAAGDAINATPAIGLGRVYVSTFEGTVYALFLANGSLAWNRTTLTAGYPVLASPAIAPNGLYVADAYENLDDFDPASGQLRFSTLLDQTPMFGSPAVDGGFVYVGTDLGALFEIGPPGGPPRFFLNGTVQDPSARPVPGALVQALLSSNVTDEHGAFVLRLPNGTFNVTVSAPGFVPLLEAVTIDGPVPPVAWVLTPVPTAPVSGRVLDGSSGRGVANASVTFYGPFGSRASTVTGADGSFALAAPQGYDYLTVGPPSGFHGYAEHRTVNASGWSGLVLTITPVWASYDGGTNVLLFLAAFAVALTTVTAWAVSRRRVAAGLSADLLSPFGTYVLMRGVILLAQAIAILAVLYVFGTLLPSVSQGVSPCAYLGSSCLPGGWQNPWNGLGAFAFGFGRFVVQLLTGDWGIAKFGSLREPARLFLEWWAPNSIQVALFALPISAALAYFVGVYAGSKPQSAFDYGARVTSIAGLLFPSFLIVLLFLGAFYEPFTQRFGDSPYGLFPSASWYFQNGGYPDWLGIAENSSPTHLPILDGAIHGDWPFVELVFLKTLWQALAISIVYVAIFLRFVRHAVATAFEEPSVIAARARGISEPTILWRHTGRRVVPMLLLVFGMTLPIYLGTQALVEALANDNGIGTLLISEMTHVASSGFGFHGVNPGQDPQSFYQVTIFLLVLVVLVGNLCADILARYLDPRLLRSAP